MNLHVRSGRFIGPLLSGRAAEGLSSRTTSDPVRHVSVQHSARSTQYADRRIFEPKAKMEKLGRLDPEALGASEPEIVFILALAGLVELLRPYLIQLLAGSNPALGLTRRETEVLSWVAGGKTNAETAEILSIAPGTVKKHLDHIYEKLDVGSRTEAVVTAMGVRPSAAKDAAAPARTSRRAGALLEP
jgi:DNA-binding CsgD family transcriptional regulator